MRPVDAALLLANLGGTAARATPLSGFSEMFGTTTGTPLANDYVNTIVVQADGKILIGGAFNTVNNVTVNRLARLASTGVPDTVAYLTEEELSATSKELEAVGYDPDTLNVALTAPPSPIEYHHFLCK